MPEDTAWIQQTWHQLNGLCYGNLIYSAPVPTPPAQYYTNWASGPTLPPVEPHVGTLVSGWPGCRKIETWTAKWRLEIPSSSDYGYWNVRFDCNDSNGNAYVLATTVPCMPGNYVDIALPLPPGFEGLKTVFQVRLAPTGQPVK